MLGTPGVYVCSEGKCWSSWKRNAWTVIKYGETSPSSGSFQVANTWRLGGRSKGTSPWTCSDIVSNIGMNGHHPNKEKHFSYTGLLQKTKRSCYSSLKDAPHIRQLLSCLGEHIIGLSIQHRWYCIIYFVILSTLHFNCLIILVLGRKYLFPFLNVPYQKLHPFRSEKRKKPWRVKTWRQHKYVPSLLIDGERMFV